MRKEFEVHRLNAEGLGKARLIADAFSGLLTEIEKQSDIDSASRGDGARELAIVRTKLEEACFFAKKALAVQAKNQEVNP